MGSLPGNQCPAAERRPNGARSTPTWPAATPTTPPPAMSRPGRWARPGIRRWTACACAPCSRATCAPPTWRNSSPAPASTTVRSPTTSPVTIARTPGATDQSISPLPNPITANPNLKPEKGQTTELGLVWSPSYVPGLNLSATYYRVGVKSIITQLSQQQTDGPLLQRQRVAVLLHPAATAQPWAVGGVINTAADPRPARPCRPRPRSISPPGHRWHRL